MAVGNAVLDVLESDGFMANVDRMAKITQDKLGAVVRKHPDVFEELRGMGLMLGLKCKVPNDKMSEKLLANGLITVGAGDNVVRLAPPLIIDESHVKEAAAIIDKTAASWAGHA
jgi:acetylornithine/N-succinyldiaminopimelate aminotransferase